MIRFLYRKIYYRLAFGAGAGLAGYLLIVLIFSLQYRYYTIPFRIVDYLSFIGLGYLMTELLVQVNMRLDRKYSWDSHPLKRVGMQALSGLVITLVVMAILRLGAILVLFPGRLVILTDEVVIVLTVLIMVLAFDLLELAIFLNTSYRNSLAELERFRKENAEYQFEMLKLQLNPHFLFNSLNTLSSLVHEDAGKASEFIRRLSDVYRYVLDNRNKELVPLKEEMEFVRSFTFLLGIRFQGMVHFLIEVKDDALDHRIAPMTLQMLLENAVKHNIASRQRPLTVRLFSIDDELWVVNNFQPKEKSENTGVGLKNIRSRYGFLTTRPVVIVDEGPEFIVKIPLI